MSKADEADDLYADLYGEEADATPKPAAQPAAAAPAPAAPAAAPTAAPASGSFIPGVAPAPPVAPPLMDKMFVGGLNWDTTEESLRKYFGQFGPVSACTVMRDGSSGRSRGFAFVTFSDPKSVNAVMVREHFLDGKIIDPKRAIPRPEQSKTQKCFVGGLPQTVTQDSFKQLFQQFGHVLDSTVMMDKDTGRPRGFGFVTFESDEGVEKTLANQPLMLDGKQIEVKRAQHLFVLGAGPYVLIALSEMFASVVSMEVAMIMAPKNMRSIVMAIGTFTTAIAAAIGEAFVALSANPLFVVNYGVFAGLSFAGAILFWLSFYKLDRKPDELVTFGMNRSEQEPQDFTIDDPAQDARIEPVESMSEKPQIA
ncbi:hypothetical protein MOBT1_000693 [Malassezia obtusa]|uniref:RRM domain-containing protein n=1 Tax=Malassezia obtusa TaxID=76774 RepID=A0AAF0DYP1_9BASI|nr:hypothetical protein MOBT1_000693 [Malassezia obtusa]